MSQTPGPLTAFARRVLALLFIGVITTLLLDAAEQIGVISKLFESFGRLCVWTMLFGLMATQVTVPEITFADARSP